MAKESFFLNSDVTKKTTNSVTLRERVPLIDLVNSGDYVLVEKLLKSKRSALNDEQLKLYVNEKNSLGEFAAIIAAQNNDFPMLELLCQYKADINLKDAYSRTVKGWTQHYKNQKMEDFVNIMERGIANETVAFQNTLILKNS